MILKAIILSIILVSFVFFALGMKKLFDPGAELSVHSCALEDGELTESGTCSKCQIKDLVNCPEKTQ